MTQTQSQQLIGKRGTVPLKGMRVEVEVIDVRESFGRTDLRIKPTAGTGEAWMSSESVQINESHS